MSIFNFPDVGEGITEGKLVKWLVKEGEHVKADQPLVEVETDKAVVEIPCPRDGFIGKLLHTEGEMMIVGKPLVDISDSGSAAPAPIQAAQTVQQPVQQYIQPVQQTQSIIPPQRTVFSSAEVLALPEVRKLAKDRGIDITKVVPSGKDGRITREDVLGLSPDASKFKQEQSVQAQSLQSSQQYQSSQSPQPTVAPVSIIADSSDALATPSTRRLARELGVDITKVIGTGDNGRITSEDVRKLGEGVKIIQPAVETKITSEHLEKKPEPKPASASSTVATPLGPEERKPLSSIRLAISRKMVESKHAAPHVTYSDEADVTELVAIRDKEKDAMQKRGVKLTYLPFFMKATVIALQKHPLLNSRMDSETNEIILKKYYHIGFAADTPEGLFVPISKDVDKKSIVELSLEIAALSQKAREMKLSLNDIQGGTFTITSIGSIGGGVFTPIINYPQVGILGIGKIVDKPVVRNGNIVIRKIVTLSLSFDHRVLDGAEAARFMNAIIEHIEDPTLLFMEMM